MEQRKRQALVNRVNRAEARVRALQDQLFAANQARDTAWRQLERSGVAYRITGPERPIELVNG